MKKLSFYFAMASVLFMTTASTCSSDDDSSNSPSPQAVINTATAGTWRITYFNDSGSIETNNFSGYDFTFATGNVLTAANGTNTYTGSWSVTNSSGSDDDNSSSDVDFNIAFSSPANFSELTEDWHIVTYNATTIQLIHVSGGNGGTDYLTFEKN